VWDGRKQRIRCDFISAIDKVSLIVYILIGFLNYNYNV